MVQVSETIFEEYKKLIILCGKLKRGCNCVYEDRCNNCQTILDIKELALKLKENNETIL